MGYAHLSESSVEWYKDYQRLESTEYSVYNEMVNGPCGTKHLANTILSTGEFGSYQLRKTHYDVNLAVIVLNEKAAAIEDIDELSIKFYPNPANDILYIQHGEINAAEVMLQSIDGKLLVNPELQSTGATTKIDLSNLPSGSYILTFSSDQHETIRERINKI